jgi:hypothetical protein
MARRAAQQNANLSKQSRLGFAPVAMSRPVVSQAIPQIQSRGNATRIVHSEYFANVSSASTDYAVQKFACNPGVASMFPWLSQVAQRFETYKFKSLMIGYHTRAATSQVGTVGMVFDFSAEDPAPQSQLQALTYEDKSADSPWKEQSMRVNLLSGDKQPSRYIRAGAPSGTYDIKTYDVGNCFIFTDGVASSTNLGLLEVYYDVELYKPQTQTPVGGSFSTGGGVDKTHLVGTTTLFAGTADSIAPFVPSSTSSLTFDQHWQGLVCVTFTGTGTTGGAPSYTITNGGSVAVLQGTATTAGDYFFEWIRINALPGSVFTPAYAAATTVTAVDYWFASADYNALA